MQFITSIDWAPNSNKIVTVSHDRTASVWDQQPDGGWKPTMVQLKSMGHGATSVKWAPCETRFALGSGAKQLQVCFYEEGNNWWLGKPIKDGINSTVFDIAFHPSSLMVAAGGVDKKICCYATYNKTLDGKDAVKAFFGGKPPKFGEQLFEVSTQSWVNGVAFSPSGNVLAAASHDSRMHFVAVNGPQMEGAQTVTLRGLPLTKVSFLSDTKCVAGGFDMVPMMFDNAGEWQCTGSLDTGRAKKAKKGGAAAMWANKTDRGGEEVHEFESTHSNNITGLFVKAGSSTEFTTSGLDGRIVYWDVDSLEGSFSNLNLNH